MASKGLGLMASKVLMDKEEKAMDSKAPMVDRDKLAVMLDMVARGKEVAAMEGGVKVKLHLKST